MRLPDLKGSTRLRHFHPNGHIFCVGDRPSVLPCSCLSVCLLVTSLCYLRFPVLDTESLLPPLGAYRIGCSSKLIFDEFFLALLDTVTHLRFQDVH